MGEVNCLYCGKAVPDDVARCPHCGAVSHFQRKGYRHGARLRFLIFFLVLVVMALVLAFWLPRDINVP